MSSYFCFEFAHRCNNILGLWLDGLSIATISKVAVPVHIKQNSARETLNIAWEANHELNLNTKDGRISRDPEAMKLWNREYETGWAPHL